LNNDSFSEKDSRKRNRSDSKKDGENFDRSSKICIKETIERPLLKREQHYDETSEKNGKINVELTAKNDLLFVDEVHFINLINNLLDNAIKYSKESGLEISLTTENHLNQFRVNISDNGIGMNKETSSRIFEKFYRAHTGNIHNVKGFGLGLSYVKAMVEAQKGTIKVDSILGKGTTFTLSFPVI
jgi:two-component system phosphate regulon sensor histidine kinase PhoR